mgnify:CR=1 FL=1
MYIHVHVPEAVKPMVPAVVKNVNVEGMEAMNKEVERWRRVEETATTCEISKIT